MAHSLHRDAGTTRRGYLGWPCPRISCGRRYVDTGCLRPGAGYVLHRNGTGQAVGGRQPRSEEHTSELQSLMRISYAVFCLKKKKQKQKTHEPTTRTLNQVHEEKKDTCNDRIQHS